jgi:AcrR family transcriptional regulator
MAIQHTPGEAGGGVAAAAPPLRADARRNRARVLDAAQQAFAEEGLAVPLDEIARRAGVGAGTVYRHFPTKEALFEAVVLGRVQDIVAYARGMAETDDAGSAFYQLLTRLVEEAGVKKDLVDALAGTDVDLAGALGRSQVALHDALGLLLERAQRAGAVRTDIGVDDLMVLLKAAFLATQQYSRPSNGRFHAAFAVIKDGLRP